MDNPISIDDFTKYLLGDVVESLGKAALKEACSLSSDRLELLLSKGKPTLEDFNAISKGLGLCVYNFKHRVADTEQVIQRLSGNSFLVPSKYTQGAYTKSFVTQALLQGIFQGSTCNDVSLVKRRFQISDEFLSGEFDVSTRLQYDIIQFLGEELGFSREMLHSLGQSMYSEYIKAGFDSRFLGKSPQECYSVLIEEVYKTLERSHDYTVLELNDDVCVFQKKLSNDVLEATEGNLYSSEHSIAYMEGLMGVFAELGGNRHINGECIEYDRSSRLEVYHLDLDFMQRPLGSPEAM